METPNKGTEITFEPYESEEDVIADGLSFDGAFQKEHIGFPGKTGIFLIVGAVLAVLGVFALILLAPRGDGHVVINEVMTSNKEAYAHPEHGSVDWIELYNPTENDVDLSGFGLTNDLKKQYKYRFPEGAILPAGGYLVVYCTGGTTASEEDPYCTGFALSRDGEGLFLGSGACHRRFLCPNRRRRLSRDDDGYPRRGEHFYRLKIRLKQGRESASFRAKGRNGAFFQRNGCFCRGKRRMLLYDRVFG